MGDVVRAGFEEREWRGTLDIATTHTPGTSDKETYIPLKTSCFSKSLVDVKEKLRVLALLGIVLVVVATGAAAGGTRVSLLSPCCCGLDGSRDSTQQADSWGRAVSVEGCARVSVCERQAEKGTCRLGMCKYAPPGKPPCPSLIHLLLPLMLERVCRRVVFMVVLGWRWFGCVAWCASGKGLVI